MRTETDFVLATLETGFAHTLHHGFPTFTLVDEAGHATESDTLFGILMTAAEGTIILLGDHMQLPPTVMSAKHAQKAYHAVSSRDFGQPRGFRRQCYISKTAWPLLSANGLVSVSTKASSKRRTQYPALPSKQCRLDMERQHCIAQ